MIHIADTHTLSQTLANPPAGLICCHCLHTVVIASVVRHFTLIMECNYI